MIPVKAGERIEYDAYFKWGFLMPRAASIQTSFDSNVKLKGENTYRYRAAIRTTSFFDNIYKTRDTLDSHYDKDWTLIFGTSHANEKNVLQIDDVSFSYRDGKVYARSYREKEGNFRFDTTQVVNTKECFSDMIGSIFFLRTRDARNMKIGEKHDFAVVNGRNVVNIQYQYRGQAIVERGNVKYNTRYYVIDIYDDAFATTREAAEVWIGDDDNFIPVKLRGKLAVGAAEIYYKSSTGLKHPMTCRIVIPK